MTDKDYLTADERAERLWMDLDLDDPTSLSAITAAIKAAENDTLERAASQFWPEGKSVGLSIDMVPKSFADQIRSLKHNDIP